MPDTTPTESLRPTVRTRPAAAGPAASRLLAVTALSVAGLTFSLSPAWSLAQNGDASAENGKHESVENAAEKAEQKAEEQKDPREEKIEALRNESQLISAEQDLRSAKLKQELIDLQEEKQRLQAEYDLMQQRQRSELAQWDLEKQKIEAERSLEQARRQAAEAELEAKIADMQRSTKLEKAEHEAKVEAMRRQIEMLNTQKQLDEAERAKAYAKMEARKAELAAQNALISAELQTKELEAKAAAQAMQLDMQAIDQKMQAREKRDKLSKVVLADVDYLEQPFQDGTLYITDRRIKLNGPIITGTADYVTERIHYYNNEDPQAPIFIVIDNCPGGSVQQGYRILKAMEASDAPIHVLVKSFAASMAATITTLAEHSYAYPNAVILHHQMSAGVSGNMTDLAETMDTLREWEERLMKPLAKKQGISVEEFRDRMYEAKSSGDWDEFATEAVKLKWVDHIVDEVREVGIRDEPTGEQQRPFFFIFMKTDETTGRAYFQLPPLEPFDAYFMYNPNGYYRVTPVGHAR